MAPRGSVPRDGPELGLPTPSGEPSDDVTVGVFLSLILVLSYVPDDLEIAVRALGTRSSSGIAPTTFTPAAVGPQRDLFMSASSTPEDDVEVPDDPVLGEIEGGLNPVLGFAIVATMRLGLTAQPQINTADNLQKCRERLCLVHN